MYKLLQFSSIAVLIAAVYTGWIFWRRHEENQRIEKAAAPPAESIPREYQSEDLKVLQFYVAPKRIQRGGKALLCYGVLNAKLVRIEPEVETLQPSLSRCVEVHPKTTTTYTLTATKASGLTKTEKVEIQVQK